MPEQIKSRYVPKGEETERLYRLEAKATEAVKVAAGELQTLLRANEVTENTDLYRDCIPETLAMLCDAFAGDLGVYRRD